MYSGKVVLFGKKLLCSSKRGYIRANLVVFVQGGCIWAKWLFLCKVVLFGQGDCNRAKVVVLVQKWLYLQKLVVIGQSGCIRSKVVVFGQKWLCLGKCCCIRARRLCLGKVVLFVQGGYIRASWLYSRKSGCNRAKFGCIWAKEDVFGQKWL